MNEAIIILQNMRGGCATVGETVHTLFRVSNRRPQPQSPVGAQKSEVSVTSSPARQTSD